MTEAAIAVVLVAASVVWVREVRLLRRARHASHLLRNQTTTEEVWPARESRRATDQHP